MPRTNRSELIDKLVQRVQVATIIRTNAHQRRFEPSTKLRIPNRAWREATVNIATRCNCCLLLAATLLAIPRNAQPQSTEVTKAPIQATSANSGREMFDSYCAPCHGKDGKGNGPAATSLKSPPANLTELAKKNNGKFPADHVAKVLKSGVSGAHGSTDMPVWGPLLSQVSGRDERIVQMRIANLVHYVESLQQK
jgi:mono/diheme cytochrome c family protein